MSDLQHPDSRAFELIAELYERVRPGYPEEAVSWLAERLGLCSGRTVLDLGAGTGKLTRSLLGTGARVIAVEPGEAMLAELLRVIPQAEALHGAAEQIPLPEQTVDAVAVGQAFHWFRHDEALPEIRRVLRPRGKLALIWNERDRESPLQEQITELIAPFVPPGRPGPESWTDPLAASELFESGDEAHFTFSQELDAERLVERIGTMSFVVAASKGRQGKLAARLRELAGAHGGRVDFPYVTSVYVSRAV